MDSGELDILKKLLAELAVLKSFWYRDYVMGIFQNLPSDNSKGTSRIILIIIILVIIFGIFSVFPFLKIPLMYLLTRTPENISMPAVNTATTKTETGKTATGKIDQNLVGNWDTGCLVPDLDSNYSERHTFAFSTDGSANHKRYIGGSTCNDLTLRDDQPMTWEIVGMGKINIYYSTGGIIYDIYEISGSNLKFGHGFCNCISNQGKTGANEEDRFTELNNFLLYKKK